MKFVTLNYDRVFDSRIGRGLKARLKKALQNNGLPERTFEKEEYTHVVGNINTIVHPHGIIAGLGLAGQNIQASIYLEPNQLRRLGYGDTGTLQNWLEQRIIPTICPVDDLNPSDSRNRSNALANKMLSEAKNCICIGLSVDGVTQSHLNFSHFDKVYCHGKDKPKPNFEPLGDGIYAKEIVDML